jgi:hypothetical protein
MTGIPNYNFDAFDAKRDEIAAAGHIPVSPADLDRAMGFEPTSELSVAGVPIDGAFLRFAIQRDVDAILQCDAIVMLEGWENSRGARGERAVAEWLGLPVYVSTDILGVAA